MELGDVSLPAEDGKDRRDGQLVEGEANGGLSPETGASLSGEEEELPPGWATIPRLRHPDADDRNL